MSVRLDEKVAYGGLMRCCTETLRLDIKEDRPTWTPVEGEILPCKWCRSSMIFEKGTWRWNHPPTFGPAA